MNLIDPIDPIHADSIHARARIKAAVEAAQARVAVWEPSPAPPAQRPVRRHPLPESTFYCHMAPFPYWSPR